MSKSGIYSITNTHNGKRYIGKSVDLAKRKQMHLWELKNNEHFNPHLQRAWNNEQEAFKFEIIELCDIEKLNDREIYWIAHYDTTNMENGYNICSGGQGTTGRPCTEDMKRKISEKNTGRKCSSEVIKKRAESKRKHMEEDEEFGDKMRELYKQHGKRIGGWQKGQKASAETKKKLSEALKGRYISESHKEKLRKLYSGEKSMTAKLKEWDVIKIRLRFLNGERQCEIRMSYPNITTQTICDIVRNRRWKSVPNNREELEKLYEQRRTEI